MEIGLSVGTCHALAGLFFIVFVILLVILLSREQALVEVGDTHILERDIGQLEVDILKTGNAHLAVETQFNKCLLSLWQSIAIDHIEIGTVLVELNLGKHKVKTYLIIYLLHLEIDGKTVLLSVSYGLDIGQIAYLRLLCGIFLAQERYLNSTIEAGTTETVLLDIQIDIVERYLPAAQLWCAVCKEAVYGCRH